MQPPSGQAQVRHQIAVAQSLIALAEMLARPEGEPITFEATAAYSILFNEMIRSSRNGCHYITLLGILDGLSLSLIHISEPTRH